MRIRFGHASGYTLTEMMVVVGIIALLSALAVPNFLDWNRKARLRDSVSSLAWNLNLARMNAVNQNALITVTVCHQTNPCPQLPPPGTANPTPNRVTVFFQNNTTGANVLPPMTMPTDLALTNATNSLVGGGITAPQNLSFNPLGLKVDTGNGNNICINTTGVPTGAACVNTDRQALNFRSLASANYNYRVVILPTGKVSWCTDATCPQ